MNVFVDAVHTQLLDISKNLKAAACSQQQLHHLDHQTECQENNNDRCQVEYPNNVSDNSVFYVW